MIPLILALMGAPEDIKFQGELINNKLLAISPIRTVLKLTSKEGYEIYIVKPSAQPDGLFHGNDTTVPYRSHSYTNIIGQYVITNGTIRYWPNVTAESRGPITK